MWGEFMDTVTPLVAAAKLPKAAAHLALDGQILLGASAEHTLQPEAALGRPEH